MLSLPVELRIVIAQKVDEVTWYHLYRVDEQFAEYAQSDEGCRKFIELFTERVQYLYECETYLFGKLHSIYDQPACVNFGDDPCKEWYYQDKRHRANDKPAMINGDCNKEYWENGKFIAYEY